MHTIPSNIPTPRYQAPPRENTQGPTLEKHHLSQEVYIPTPTDENPMSSLRAMRNSQTGDVYGRNPAQSSQIDRCGSSACMCIPCM